MALRDFLRAIYLYKTAIIYAALRLALRKINAKAERRMNTKRIKDIIIGTFFFPAYYFTLALYAQPSSFPFTHLPVQAIPSHPP